MKPVESDRPRPGILRVRRRWWKRTTFWFLFVVFAMAISIFIWVLITMLHRYGEDDDDSRRREPGSCLRVIAG